MCKANEGMRNGVQPRAGWVWLNGQHLKSAPTDVKGALAFNTATGCDRQHAFGKSVQKRSLCSEKWTRAVARGATRTFYIFALDGSPTRR